MIELKHFVTKKHTLEGAQDRDRHRFGLLFSRKIWRWRNHL